MGEHPLDVVRRGKRPVTGGVVKRPAPVVHPGERIVLEDRPLEVDNWMAAWQAYRRDKMPRMTEFEIVDYILALERTVADQRVLLRTAGVAGVLVEDGDDD